MFETGVGLQDQAAREALLVHWFRNDPAGLEKMRGLLRASVESASFFVEARERRISAVWETVGDMESCRAEAASLPVEGPGSRIGR